MWIAGVVALAVAAICGGIAFVARRRRHQMITTETYSVGELRTLQAAAANAAGAGYFRQKCEVVGVAEPGPAGTLTAEMSSAECLWHRHVVTRKYWKLERRNDTTRRVQKQERVTERQSKEPFMVADETGQILVHPADALEHMEKVVDRFEPYDETQDKTTLSMGSLNIALPGFQREGTIGYQYEEWVLRPGRRLYVLGEARDTAGELAIDEPALVSTKDEETLLRETRRRELIATVAGAVAGIAGIVLVLVDLLG